MTDTDTSVLTAEVADVSPVPEAAVTPAVKEYELGFLLRAEEDKGKIAAVLKEHKVGVKSEGPLRRIALSYPIRKMTSAVFGFVRFQASPSTAKEIEKVLAIGDQALRSLLIKVPALTESRLPESGYQRRPRPTVPAPAPEKRLPPPGVLSNEALEKKIEEILQ
ncbi:MAG: 30S ribosomal protein S6 [Candidatus Liptonbacteria bacterium]|nr:30S ribosomal protein S6 [Candidatus Liptonbacteria bacterium]